MNRTDVVTRVFPSHVVMYGATDDAPHGGAGKRRGQTQRVHVSRAALFLCGRKEDGGGREGGKDGRTERDEWV